MSLRFTGSFEELKILLAFLDSQGKWIEIGATHRQFRHNTNGGIVNWYVSTGTIAFQGKVDGKEILESQIKAALSGEPQLQSAESVNKQSSPVTQAETSVATTSQAHAAPPTNKAYLGNRYSDSELVIGLVGAVGTELKQVIDIITDRLKTNFGYTIHMIHISRQVIPIIADIDSAKLTDEFSRLNALMDGGNDARSNSRDNSILALGVAARISHFRSQQGANEGLHPVNRVVHIVSSLKHPDEVARLREIYSEGFYLVGVHCDIKRRTNYLVKEKRASSEQAERLIVRDEDEHLPHGQRTSDTFHLSDFFVRLDSNHDRLKHSTWRILDVLFGHPYITPTFDEYAMFMAFSASLRSADLSRQVGAVVSRNKEILASGANDCPKCGGGLYWPEIDNRTGEFTDSPLGRDYKREVDSNKIEQKRIIESILDSLPKVIDRESVGKALSSSRIMELTEFGRVVHAEMEALLCCARNGISTRGADLYGTTFPCHNCAKHIIASGILRVIYIEPYPKSKAAEFHSDAVSFGYSDSEHLEAALSGDSDAKVCFEAFVGVGPRRFFDLFSMRLGSGYPIQRKQTGGSIVDWHPGKKSRLRIQMLPCSYMELELLAASEFHQHLQGKRNADSTQTSS